MIKITGKALRYEIDKMFKIDRADNFVKKFQVRLVLATVNRQSGNVIIMPFDVIKYSEIKFPALGCTATGSRSFGPTTYSLKFIWEDVLLSQAKEVFKEDPAQVPMLNISIEELKNFFSGLTFSFFSTPEVAKICVGPQGRSSDLTWYSEDTNPERIEKFGSVGIKLSDFDVETIKKLAEIRKK